MLTYNLEQRNDEPKYYYIYKMIRRDIERGKLKKGEKLPSKRSLAEHLGISLITVENAYQMLKDEGYIEPRERSGYYVCEIHVIGEMKEQNQQLHMLPRYRKKSKMDDCRMQHFPAFHIPCILRPCEVLLQNMEKNCCIVHQMRAVRFCETVLHPICCVIVDYLHSRNRLLSDRERNICMVRLCVFLERIRFMELKIRPIIRSGKSMRERVRSVKCCLWGKMESGVMCWHRQGQMCCM